jgi:exosortase
MPQTTSAPPHSIGECIQRNPLPALLLAMAVGVLVYFYGVLVLYSNHTISGWAWMRYLPEYNQEHSKLIPLIFLFLIWYHRKALWDAEKQGSNWGLLLLGIGVVLYVLAARCIQARLAIFALPFLLTGAVLFIWGRQVTRILAFSFAFLIFLVPAGAIEQMSFRLQFVITGLVERLSALVGIKIYSVGTTLHAVNASWGYDIAEGCSGIRSLIAMIMLTTVYAHIFEKTLWKKVALVVFSLVFAVIGNVGRIFTIIIIARLGYPKLRLCFLPDRPWSNVTYQ